MSRLLSRLRVSPVVMHPYFQVGHLKTAAATSSRRFLSATAIRGSRAALTDLGIKVGGLDTTRREALPHKWLRDSCRCSACVNQKTMQRNITAGDLSSSTKAVDIKDTPEGLQVEWNDGHLSEYSWDFLVFYSTHDGPMDDTPISFSWAGSDMAARPECDLTKEDISNISGAPVINYEALMDPSDAGVAGLTAALRQTGFGFVTGAPTTPEATKAAIERIAFIRNTHYGGFYDFIPDLAMADTAYTNEALAAHTDTAYFTDPAGLQVFHMLEHTPPADVDAGKDLGGMTLLVDGWKAAEILKEEDPDAHNMLKRLCLNWHASGNEGISITGRRRAPVLQFTGKDKNLLQIRWNEADRCVLPLTREFSESWFAAAGKFEAILRRPEVEYWTQLAPGKILFINNWRVLHGRSAFIGMRRMCGGYVNNDDFMSRWRTTNTKSQVMRQVTGY